MSAGTLGFVGLGNMGAPMAANLAAAGHDLVCFDIAGTEARLPPGARAAAGASAVFAAADTLFLSLPDGAASLAVAAELAAAADRRVRTVVDLSTVGPAAAEAAARSLGEVGIVYADGPVSGGASGARARTIALMFSGPRRTFDELRPVLCSFAGNVFWVGDRPGQGQAMKLVNNFLSATAMAATSEALTFGLSAGLDLEVMLDVVNASSGRNSATVDKFPNRVVTGTFDAGFATALMAKDVKLYLDAVGAAGGSDGVARAVAALWSRADEALPGTDFTRIWDHVRRGEP